MRSDRPGELKSHCKGCVREWHKNHYEKNKPARLAQIAKYKAENDAYRKAQGERYRERVKDRIRERNKAFRKANPHKVCAYTRKHQAAKLRAVPKWADLKKIELVYRKAKEWGMEVDHIVPLQSNLVCGLHVWENLQLLARDVNGKKSNLDWPDKP